MDNNFASFCTQTGTRTTINDSDFPVRLCVRSNGNVNVGTSQSKTHKFNVEGDSNFENLLAVTAIDVTGAYHQDGVQMIYNGGTNPYYNCRVIANLSLVANNANGMFVNYGSLGTNPDLRCCAGGTNDIRLHYI